MDVAAALRERHALQRHGGNLRRLCGGGKASGLKGDKLRSGFGIAASFAAGIRCNFGTMTKPFMSAGPRKTASPPRCSLRAVSPPIRML